MTELTKPEIEFPTGPAPESLEIEDIGNGNGAEATANSTVDVHYLGVGFESGEEFDSSWSRGESINFPLRSLIAGWQQGIPGMKVDGQRLLVIPGELGYGEAGTQGIGPNETLAFVIQLEAIG